MRVHQPAASFVPTFDAILRSDLLTFIGKTFQTLNPAAGFVSNWHLEAIAWHLEQVQQGRIKRLIINLPPRSLKSISASVALPAHILGLDPSAKIICASYGSELSIKNANDFRAVISAPWFRRAFPNMRVSPVKNTEFEVMTTAKGFRLATSVGGPLTGRGGDLIIIDDPLKAIDALSEAKREAANQWFTNTLLSRLDDKVAGAIIVVMQRVHVDDLSGFLTANSDDWVVLRLPAIAEEDQLIAIGEGRFHRRKQGELLHPDREPRAVLEDLRRKLGSDAFSAQYQQSPMPPGGAMIKRDWIQRYTHLPPDGPYSHVIQSWDSANKGGSANDWSVCTTWQVDDGQLYLVDVYRERLDYPELKAKAFELAERYDPARVLIEDAGTGTALIEELRMKGVSAIPVVPDRDKITRMSIESAKFEAGLVHFPKEAHWLAVLEAELLAFPNVRHDDQVDSISQALAGYHRLSMFDVL